MKYICQLISSSTENIYISAHPLIVSVLSTCEHKNFVVLIISSIIIYFFTLEERRIKKSKGKSLKNYIISSNLATHCCWFQLINHLFSLHCYFFSDCTFNSADVTWFYNIYTSLLLLLPDACLNTQTNTDIALNRPRTLTYFYS